MEPPAKVEKSRNKLCRTNPAWSFSSSSHFPFNRAGGRTSNIGQEL
jgi:hypothetical protein